MSEEEGLRLDWESMALAVENQLPQFRSFLHRGTGQLLTLELTDGQAPALPGQKEDWIQVEPRPSREGYRTMQRFLDRIEEPALKSRLATALVGKGAFRRFKDLLLDYPDVRQLWFAFKDEEVYAYIQRWLQREGLEVANPPPEAATAYQRMPPSSARELVVAGEGEDLPDWREAIAPYNRPERTFEPSRAALLIVDMQKIFADPKGSSYLPMSRTACLNLARLLDAWRSARLPVFFTRHMHSDPSTDGGALSRWWRSLIMQGTFDSEIVDALSPLQDERVVVKCRYSAFAGTDMDMLLREAGVRDLVIGGVMTNLCCETTAREAFVRNFNVFFLGDGTATAEVEMHLGSLRNIAFGFGRVLSVEEAIAIVS
ncbi:MAG: isochorismatase family protein [Deltaproteobacteria bacterium]|nr:isochorismatase family protein [Deltaproteobacteria bacterium]